MTIEPQIDGTTRRSVSHYQAGLELGKAAQPLPDDASPQFKQGWTAGGVERRVLVGEVIAVAGSGSRCVKCKEVNYGLRGGCGCWPDGGFNFERNEREGYRMEYGALVLSLSPSRELVFMSHDDLVAARAAGKPVVDMRSGKEVTL